jgi:hypothetical protein
MEIIIFIGPVLLLIGPEILHGIGNSCRDCTRIDISTDHRNHKD